MSSRVCLSWALLLGTCLAACGGTQPSAAGGTGKGAASNSSSNGAAASGAKPSTPAAMAGSGALPSTSGSDAGTSSAGSSTVIPRSGTTNQPLNCNQVNSPFKVEGCACTMGETSACWTGSPADRNMGKCHDGLQVCEGTTEFASWSECKGEELSCGVDAGVPETEEECQCIPGAVIQCSEDCSVGIICSLTATKTCLPDGTWSTCREDLGVTVDLPGFQCRNMLHGCLSALSPDDPQYLGEIFVGDCSKQFKCGHAPPPPPPPPVLPE